VVFSEALEVVCELDTALDAVLEVAAARVAANIVSDVAAERRVSGHERGGWGVSWGAEWGGLGSVCRLFWGSGCCSEARGVVVVAVVNIVDVVDGVHAGVVPGDVAVVAGTGGLVTGAVVAWVSLQVCGAVFQVLGSSVDVPASFSRRGGSSLGSVCVTVSAVVVGAVWVLESTV
jgi:hypothetical protein